MYQTFATPLQMAGLPAALNCEFHNTPAKGNPQMEFNMPPLPNFQNQNPMKELWEMHKQTQQKLDVLIDIQRQMLEASLQAQAKE